jgi:hypothetical protein
VLTAAFAELDRAARDGVYFLVRVVTPVERSEAARLVASYVDQHFDMAMAVSTLASTGAEFRITGGVARSALLSHERCTDLDLIVRGSGDDVVRCFRDLGLEQTKTRYGGTRFYWNRLPIDLIETPSEGTFEQGISSVLASFDLDVNAIAVNATSDEVSEFPGALDSLAARRVRLIRPAWQGNKIIIANQCIRLVKLLFETRRLRVDAEDTAFLTSAIIPQLATTDWTSLRSRFPHGPSKLAELLSARLMGAGEHSQGR